MPAPSDFHALSLALDRAETLLSTAGESIDRTARCELRARIARARAELDFLTALANARSSAELPPLWMQSPATDGKTGDSGA